jgi:hypothetical protein
MASPRYEALITIGPAKSLDSSSAGDFVAPGDGAVASNISTNRVVGAISNELGRQNLVTLTHFPTGQITNVSPYVASESVQQYVLNVQVSGTTSVVMYDPTTMAQPLSTITNAALFDSAVQFGGILYTNSGQQYSSNNPNNFYSWQYGAPNAVVYEYSVTTGSGALPAGTYYYAFTQVVQIPNGGPLQETSATGALPVTGPPPPTTLYPYAVTSGGSQSAIITGTFSGTTADGATFTTNLYRQSTNVPVWTLVANLTGTTYTDNASDTQIGANQELQIYQDPPPLSGGVGGPGGAIFVHLSRIWCFVLVNDYASNFVPQCQLWYSEFGVPYYFNQVAQEDGGQVLVVDNSGTPNTTPGSQTYQGYGDIPIAGVSMGGTALLFKSRSTSLLFGNDQDTFFTTPAFPIGCISRRSVISALGQIWWLSEDGAYTFNGTGPQYLSQKVRNTLKSIPMQDQINAVSSFSNLTWYISFPQTGITLAYYTVTGEWHTLPYSCSAAASIPANPVTPLTSSSFTTQPFASVTGQPNEVVAARFSSNALDNWFVTEADLGAPNSGTWQSPLTTSGAPHIQKTYDYVTIYAPFQAGSCTFTLTIDPGSTNPKVFTQTVTDLSAAGSGQSETRHIWRVSPDLRGYSAQLSVTLTTTTGQTVPTSLYLCQVWGTFDRALVIPE